MPEFFGGEAECFGDETEFLGGEPSLGGDAKSLMRLLFLGGAETFLGGLFLGGDSDLDRASTFAFWASISRLRKEEFLT